MTNGWTDIKNTDLVFVMGGNPAENHPCGFKWAIEAKKNRNAKIVVVDPRFTRTAAVADIFAQLRAGTDIAFLSGIMRYAIEKKRFHEDYVKLHTNAPYVIGEKFQFTEGLFSGFDQTKAEYDKNAWQYQADPKTNAYMVDETLQNPRCVFQLLKQHVSRYTPEMVEQICGTPKDQFIKIAEAVTSTGNPERVGTILYALGWTQHSTGVQIIRAAAMLQLLLGNVGRPGGGVNALRGHSNIQGATDMGGTFEILPGYLKTPTGATQTLAEYLEKGPPTTLNKQSWASMNYWQNYPKFMVSLLKAYYGRTATKENDYNYALMPKVDGNYSWMYLFDDMYRGSSTRAGGKEPGPEGLISFGMNPVGTGPNSPKMVAALSKLKWLVMVENFENETATFWKAPKDPTKIIKKKGEQVDGFAQLQDDGTTMCGNWLHSGVYSSAGNLAARRNNADPLGLGMFHEWAFSWPANRRVMYNRASADKDGKPWDPTRPGIVWNGEKWVGDVPDIKPDSPPGQFGAFIMLPEGVGRLYSPVLNDGPFPEHYEAIEAPVDNVLHAKVTSNPVSKKFSTDKDKYGGRDQFPIVCTTYRLTEHFHYWTKHHINGRLNEVQPEFFFEIPEELAKEKGIANGSKVKVTSARGSIVGPAVVTKRILSMNLGGKKVWQIGFPIHWGYAGDPKHAGPLANLLTPSAMDPNTWTPEFKTFLVRVEKATGENV